MAVGDRIEMAKKSDYDALVTLVNNVVDGAAEEVLNSEVVQTAIDDKLLELETNYAPRLTGVESDFASIVTQFTNIADGQIQAVLQDEIVRTSIDTKLLAKETEYAPRLTAAEAGLAKVDSVALRVTRDEKILDNLTSLSNTLSPDVSVSSYNPVNFFSTNAREGQANVKIKGRLLKNELSYNRDTWAEWTKSAGVVGDSTGLEFTADHTLNIVAELNGAYKTSTKYGVLYTVVSSTLTNDTSFMTSSISAFPQVSLLRVAGNQKLILTSNASITDNKFRFYVAASEAAGNKIKLRDIRIFELPSGSDMETDFNTLSADELAIKYPYVQSQRDAKGGRIRTTGKNLFNGTYDIGYIDPANGAMAYEAIKRRSKRIACKANTAYTISGGDRNVWRIENAFGSLLSYANSATITTPSNAQYFYCYYSSTGTHEQVQIEEGSVATAHQPYQETLSYLPDVGKSLPNGTRDEINVSTGEKTQKIKDYVLKASDIVGIYTSLTSADVVHIQIPSDGAEPVASQLGKVTLDGYSEIISFVADSADNIGKYYYGTFFYSASAKRLALYVAKGAYTSLAAAQVALTGKKLTYQLATPITTLLLPQPLKSTPSGSVIWEPIKGEVSFYGTKASVTDTTLPIKSIVRLYKVSKVDGSETPLAISSAVIASDKLSFTHPGLADGDLIDWDYEYDSQYSLNPLIELAYQNGWTENIVVGNKTLVFKGGILVNVITS